MECADYGWVLSLFGYSWVTLESMPLVHSQVDRRNLSPQVWVSPVVGVATTLSAPGFVVARESRPRVAGRPHESVHLAVEQDSSTSCGRARCDSSHSLSDEAR